MKTDLPVYCGENAVSDLIDYCSENGIAETIMVADQNTYAALGKRLARGLRDQGVNVESVVLTGDEIVADAHHILQVLIHSGQGCQTYLAVGSGTLTDITRFVSHRTGSSFLSVPTAPSVDGFASIGAPLVVGGVKRTIITHAPRAIFVDLPTIRNAPRELIAAGFGDVVGKYTSIADWRLGHLLWDEPYDESIAQRSLAATERCVDLAENIGKGTEEAVHVLMESLIELGLCMLDFGCSHPASGSEHHYSHYWEMRLLRENRPAILHGAKVGVASVLVAQDFERLRRLTFEDLMGKLRSARLPDREKEIRRIRAAYGAEADEVIKIQSEFLDMPSDQFEMLKRRVAEHWEEVQTIAASVPSSQEMVNMLQKAKAQTKAQSLGLADTETKSAVEYSHYLRNRFTVRKASYLLGL